MSHSSSKGYAIHIVSPSGTVPFRLELSDVSRQVLLMSESVSTNTVAVSNRLVHTAHIKSKACSLQVFTKAPYPYLFELYSYTKKSSEMCTCVTSKLERRQSKR